MLYTFLYNIARELVLAELEYLPFEFVQYRRLVSRLATLEHMLYYIIAILILNEANGATEKLVQDWCLQNKSDRLRYLTLPRPETPQLSGTKKNRIMKSVKQRKQDSDFR
jgi:hypothetical protein